MKSERDKAVESVKYRLDKIYDVYTDRDFVEITGTVGGDTIQYRVDNNGNIYVR